MIKSKYFSSSSSIPISFASVFLFSALFAACCFTFLYFQPLQLHDNHIHGINRNSHIIEFEDLGDPISPQLVLEDDNDADQDDRIQNQEPPINSTISSLPSSMAEPPMAEVGEAAQQAEPKATNNNPPLTEEEEEELYTPPLNLTAEERIAWFKKTLPRMKIFESNKRTRRFDQRIQEFFEGCEVRIFMTWISPSSIFGNRELFSVESALKSHPEGCVVIVSNSMDSKQGRDLVRPLVKRGYKILPAAPDLSLLCNGTGAGDWLEKLKSGEFDPGTIPITRNLSHLLPILLLYKFGGIYLDSDVIVLKDMSELRNCVGVQTLEGPGRLWSSLNDAVLIFDQSHPLLLALITEFTSGFDGNSEGHNGDEMISRIVMSVAFNDSTSFDFNIMSPNAFYPVEIGRIPKYFRHPKNENETQWTYNEEFALKQQSYVVHLWSFVSGKLKIERKSVVQRLISDHCILCRDVYDKASS